MEVFKSVFVVLGVFFSSQCLSREVNEAEPKLLLELLTRGNKTFFAEFATDVQFYKKHYSKHYHYYSDFVKKMFVPVELDYSRFIL